MIVMGICILENKSEFSIQFLLQEGQFLLNDYNNVLVLFHYLSCGIISV